MQLQNELKKLAGSEVSSTCCKTRVFSFSCVLLTAWHGMAWITSSFLFFFYIYIIIIIFDEDPCRIY